MSITNQTDSQIIEQILRGDSSLYEELIERYQNIVYGIAWSKLGNPDLCEDALQETFIQGYRFLNTLRNRDKFGPWIGKIARNKSLTIKIQNQNELKKLSQWQLEQPLEIEKPANEDNEEIEVLQKTIEDLTEKHRECLVLFYIEDKSVQQAAQQLSISETAFKTRLHRARKELKDKMEIRLEQSLNTLQTQSRIQERNTQRHHSIAINRTKQFRRSDPVQPFTIPAPISLSSTFRILPRLDFSQSIKQYQRSHRHS